MIKINDQIIEQNHFPDGTQLLKYDALRRDTFNIFWKYENDSELFTLICLVKHIKNTKPNYFRIELDLDYMPNARMDRVKNSDEVFTLKYFCEIINSLEFNTVYVNDVHSNVTLALLNNVVERKPYINIYNVINKIIENYNSDKEFMLFYPDEGAMKRYSDGLNLPFAFGVKKRNWETGAIEGLDLMGEIDSIAGRNILIIDDICSKGGTFYHSAKRLKEAGAANIYLYVTHCENTIHEGELLKSDLIKHIYTTDSILTKEHEKITVVE